MMAILQTLSTKMLRIMDQDQESEDEDNGVQKIDYDQGDTIAYISETF